MHELGIVFHCIKEVNAVARENGVKRVSGVTLQLGEVSGVLTDYFEDCWNWAVKKEEVLRGAKIYFETIPAVTHCDECGADYQTVKYAKICPNCGSGNTYLLRGNEIFIKNIEVADE